ncbi:MAG: AAA family ATPase [Proteobacteria bacterium]|nr:AAA family ATPase [Pseudomonadota bacterium]
MKVLSKVRPTPEQLKILSDLNPGVTLIRGAAGSGKTTTAILRLKQLVGSWQKRAQRMGRSTPVRVLVLTFNRTLCGYIEALARDNVQHGSGVELHLETFSGWAKKTLNPSRILARDEKRNRLRSLISSMDFDREFLLDEIEYARGRFLPDARSNYLSAKRIGRGTSPRFIRADRDRLLQVIKSYEDGLQNDRYVDWGTLAVAMAQGQHCPPYDIIIADETQDFSANQIRALMKHAAREHTVTLLIDAAQRIYARGFTWKEAGAPIQKIHTLSRNYRNTRQIARFVEPLLRGMELDGDGVLSRPEECQHDGPMPEIVEGLYSQQVDYTLRYIHGAIDLSSESIAFLHPKGWFDHLERALHSQNLPYVKLTRQRDWPAGAENIALSTMNSAKGVEFDHVFIVGFNTETAQHGDDRNDTEFLRLRRLLAVSITRARHRVVIGYKPSNRPSLVDLFEPNTYRRIRLMRQQ